MDNKNIMITGETGAEWDASHRKMGYIPLERATAIRQVDGTWLIDIDPYTGRSQRVGIVHPDPEHADKWKYRQDVKIRMTKSHVDDIAALVRIISGVE
jgi:hypothetical protein